VPAATTAVQTRGKHVGALGLPTKQLPSAGTGEEGVQQCQRRLLQCRLGISI
jgi:hypothetical protein